LSQTPAAPRLLLVDDDPNILDTARDILEDAGYEVEVSATAAAGQAILAEKPCRLALIDFNLPDGTGLDFALKAHSLDPRLRIVLMTGEATVELGSASSVIDEILTKPVNIQQLLLLIEKELAK
jgi:DNA-binding NtrC family response regulator